MKRLKLNIMGLVQGVGFRPFVYEKALKNDLSGHVLNNSIGVSIEVQGSLENLDNFLHELQYSLPPLARIDELKKSEMKCKNQSDFKILKSDDKLSKLSPVMPDMAICDECLSELKDPKNRRFKYPFINCTNCGPRYSIINNIPYDRPQTSMAKFKMCKKCQNEYENPLNRRYHAQPISCHECGVRLEFISKNITLKGDIGIQKVAYLINEGKIVAIKGIGGFHLVCDATNPAPIQKLRKFKSRPIKPFAVMCEDLAQALKHAKVDDDEKNALKSIEKPIVLLTKTSNSNICKEVAPCTNRLGIFLPNTPLHVMLFEFLKAPIIATSANIKGEPIITDVKNIDAKFGDLVDAILDYNRDIIHLCDDSVLQIIDGKKLYLRLSRSIAPLSIFLEHKCTKNILCVGAEQKNQIAFYFQNRLIISPYLGDMSGVKSYELFTKTIEDFKRFYGLDFDLIICDKHPNYATTKWTKSQNLPFLQVYHHHAHILSVLLDAKMPLNTKVLGIAWDGTGYGEDGSIWGGEFLLVEGKKFKRIAHFKPFKLLGGDKSVKNIDRIAYSMLLDLGLELEEFAELKFLAQMHQKNINSPLCSSVGRLFDAVCYLITGLKQVSYDGESGLMIESLYDENITQSYDFSFENGVINYDKMLLSILKERENKSLVASKFLNTLCKIVLEISLSHDLPLVLSGGVFQNKTLLKLLLKNSKKPPIFPTQISPNDGGICVGQMAYGLL